MARVYAVEEETDHRFLVRIECDEPGCNASILPNPDIATNGWVKRGCWGDGASTFESAYCPDHA